MLTVPEAASRSGRNAETIRRWIRAGRLRSTRVGTQYLVEPDELDSLTQGEDTLPLPDSLRTMPDGRPQPPWVRIIREQRTSH